MRSKAYEKFMQANYLERFQTILEIPVKEKIMIRLADRRVPTSGPYPAEVFVDLRRFVNQLPACQRKCLLLSLEDKLSVSQIARILNVSRRAVNKSISCALSKIEYYLADEWNL